MLLDAEQSDTKEGYSSEEQEEAERPKEPEETPHKADKRRGDSETRYGVGLHYSGHRMQPDAPPATELDTASPGYQIIHCPRGSRGDGTASVHRDSIKVRVLNCGISSKFELLVVKLTSLSPPNIVASIYRPWCGYAGLPRLAGKVVRPAAALRYVVRRMCDDINCSGASGVTLDANVTDILDNHGLMQHVEAATHDGGNFLDVVVTTDDDVQLVSHTLVEPTYFSDHNIFVGKLNVFNRRSTVVQYMFRDIRRINIAALHDDIRKSPLFEFYKYCSVDQYIELFQCEITCSLDRHAPLKVKSRRMGWNDCR
jgi:hypothetical protein